MFIIHTHFSVSQISPVNIFIFLTPSSPALKHGAEVGRVCCLLYKGADLPLHRQGSSLLPSFQFGCQHQQSSVGHPVSLPSLLLELLPLPGLLSCCSLLRPHTPVVQ